MNLTPLKYLLFVENITCVFRNLLCLKKRTRVFVIIWVLYETGRLAANIVLNYRHEIKPPIKAQIIYLISVYFFSIYIMLGSLYYSRRFYKLLLNFDEFYNIFEDNVYNQRMERAQKVLTFLVVSFCSTIIFVFTCARVFYGDHDTGVFDTSLTQYNISISDFRYIFQYFVLYSILFVESEQLRAITRSIDRELSRTKADRVHVAHLGDISNTTVTQDRMEKIQQWEKAYKNINHSSYLCNSIFGIQLSVMLLIVTAFYIILLYSIAIITVEGVATVTSLLMNTFSMVVFLVALLVISRAGQQVQNSSVKLRQKLCELCVYSIENEDYYKLTKDLLRCIRTRPIRVHVFGSLNVNMSMLPSIVAFFTTYTVIALQFNNVL